MTVCNFYAFINYGINKDFLILKSFDKQTTIVISKEQRALLFSLHLAQESKD